MSLNEIVWKNPLSIAAQSAEYKITSVLSGTYDILNLTDGNILINRNGDFSETENCGNYITLPNGMAYNDLALNHSDLYIKSSGSGIIVVVRKD